MQGKKWDSRAGCSDEEDRCGGWAIQLGYSKLPVPMYGRNTGRNMLPSLCQLPTAKRQRTCLSYSSGTVLGPEAGLPLPSMRRAWPAWGRDRGTNGVSKLHFLQQQ